MSALAAQGLAKAFGRPGLEPVEVLRELELEVEEGELVAVRGASGSGKSTLLHVLGGMLAPDAGSLRLDDEEPWRQPAARRARWRNACVGFVFQRPNLIEELDALENVLVPAWLAGRREDGAARELLERLGLGGRLRHRPSELSGGEAQRVAVARALLLRPRGPGGRAHGQPGRRGRGAGLRRIPRPSARKALPGRSRDPRCRPRRPLRPRARDAAGAVGPIRLRPGSIRD